MLHCSMDPEACSYPLSTACSNIDSTSAMQVQRRQHQQCMQGLRANTSPAVTANAALSPPPLTRSPCVCPPEPLSVPAPAGRTRQPLPHWETSMSGTDNRPRAPKRDGEQGRARRRSDSLQARTRPAAAAQPAKASREQPEQKDSSPGGSSAPSEQCYLCRTLLRVLRDKQPRCPL